MAVSEQGRDRGDLVPHWTQYAERVGWSALVLYIATTNLFSRLNASIRQTAGVMGLSWSWQSYVDRSGIEKRPWRNRI
jgi:hypothetical protein